MVLCCIVNLVILAHGYNASIECFILHITFLTKENVAVALKHAFAFFYVPCC